VDLLFVDTTSLYVYRDIETEWRRHGYSRDRRGDLPQFVLCVAVDRVGWPVAWEILPGNTMDRAAFLKMIERLRTRLKIRRVVIVADRAMMDKGTLAALINDGNAPFEFILGCRMRQSRQVREDVLGSDGEYQKVAENLWVREVRVAGSRYVVCYNPEEAKRDAALREHIVANLQEELKRRHKEVISNKGFKRFLTFDRDAVQIDQAAVEADACFDGAFVLHTNTQLPADQVAKSYKSLWRVERTFREEKSTLQVRPIFHHRDDTSIGHIVASFLALRLEVDLQRRLDEKHIDVSWPDLMRELSAVQAVHIELDARAWRIRTDLQGAGYAAFQAAGVRPPARVTPLPGTDI
jgi:transposase